MGKVGVYRRTGQHRPKLEALPQELAQTPEGHQSQERPLPVQQPYSQRGDPRLTSIEFAVASAIVEPHHWISSRFVFHRRKGEIGFLSRILLKV